jgi:hypothetical protein
VSIIRARNVQKESFVVGGAVLGMLVANSGLADTVAATLCHNTKIAVRAHRGPHSSPPRLHQSHIHIERMMQQRAFFPPSTACRHLPVALKPRVCCKPSERGAVSLVCSTRVPFHHCRMVMRCNVTPPTTSSSYAHNVVELPALRFVSFRHTHTSLSQLPHPDRIRSIIIPST